MFAYGLKSSSNLLLGLLWNVYYRQNNLGRTTIFRLFVSLVYWINELKWRKDLYTNKLPVCILYIQYTVGANTFVFLQSVGCCQWDEFYINFGWTTWISVFLGFVEVMDLVWQGFFNIIFSIVCGGPLGTHDISVMISILIDFILISVT